MTSRTMLAGMAKPMPTLALSLHAPDDELRDTLVPVNNRWSISEALDAARYYADQARSLRARAVAARNGIRT